MREHTRRLPGIQPAAPGDWLRVDDAYGAQMALREELLTTRSGDVLATCEGSETAQEELLELVLDELAALGFCRNGDVITCPDGREVRLEAPLPTLGRLVQEDFCILQKRGAEHVLTAAVLCFPASWSLAEKIGRPLVAIHDPVAPYDEAIAARVQRLFDAIRPGQVLWRANALFYHDAALHQPRRAAAPDRERAPFAPYIRSERQCLRRLPKTGAVVFSIHTVVVRREALEPHVAASLKTAGLDHA
ncbi:MAG: heme-dependent oxidative N-demethylase family protein [Brevirhabdus sp.]